MNVSYLEVEHVGTLEAHDFWRLEEVPGEREEELHADQRRPHQEEPVLARHPRVATASAGMEAAATAASALSPPSEEEFQDFVSLIRGDFV